MHKDTSKYLTSVSYERINGIFVEVKIKTFISLGVIAFVLTACPSEPSSFESDLEKLQNNKMDFPDLRTQYYEGINYKLSDLFYRIYYDEFVIQDDAVVRIIEELDLYFTVELFSEEDAIYAQNEFTEEIDLLDAVHDMYAIKRINSLDQSSVSVKKEVPENVQFPGYIQVISGSTYKNNYPTTYFMATLKVEDEYYVFQMIGKKENMGYLHDDFIDIISSVSR